MQLHDLRPSKGSTHRKKRLGSGESSGLGKTCGKGDKGQKARAGGSIRPGFEGGQMPLIRRLPKRGFNNKNFKSFYAPVNLSKLDSFNEGDTVDEAALREKRLVTGRWDGIKILGNGEISKKLYIKVHSASQSALEKVQKAGGKIEIVALSQEGEDQKK
ncbi:MAG: 50S ribosomal protein L15 [Verrucomicrobiota bacterium]